MLWSDHSHVDRSFRSTEMFGGKRTSRTVAISKERARRGRTRTTVRMRLMAATATLLSTPQVPVCFSVLSRGAKDWLA